MSHDQLEAIATAIQPTQPLHVHLAALFRPHPLTTPLYLLQVRLDGMRHLLQFPSGDLISCDNWDTLLQAVRHALMDSDTELSVS